MTGRSASLIEQIKNMRNINKLLDSSSGSGGATGNQTGSSGSGDQDALA
jgi:hypothetical protein